MYSYIINHVFIVQNSESLPPNSGLILGVCGALLVTFFVWPINGGLACIQHLVLRILLWKSRDAPWNYTRFLDYAYERILLRKVGGGYVFVHRLLLEYFASLDEVTAERSSSRVAE